MSLRRLCLKSVSISVSVSVLQQVPECTDDIFRPGSVTPAARLFDAFEAFEKQVSNDCHQHTLELRLNFFFLCRQDVKADELIRSISSPDVNKLEEAIEKCVCCLPSYCISSFLLSYDEV